MVKKIITLVFLATAFVSGWAQQTNSYIPYKTFDGEHKNEISGYVMGGNNVVTDKFGGLEGSSCLLFFPASSSFPVNLLVCCCCCC